MMKRMNRSGSSSVFLQTALLVLGLIIFFYLYRFLVARAYPPFPVPVFTSKGKAVFDTGRIKSPVLLSFAVSPKGKIAMLDSKSGVIQVFSAEGALLAQTPSEFPGGSKPSHPLGITFGEKEELFLADTGNQRILRFAAGLPVKTFGRAGIFNGQFVLPTSLLSFDGNLFVLDSALCRIQQFNSGGFFISKTGRRGDGPGAFNVPTELIRDPNSNIIVLDSRNSTLSQYDFLLNFSQQRKVSTSGSAFPLTKAAFTGEGLSLFLSKERQEIAVFFQNTAVGMLTPRKLGIENAFWTDIAGQENLLYILDGKNMKVDIFELL